MNQYSFDNNHLKLNVKKAPILIRGVLFFFAFSSFFMPLTGMLFSIISGNGFHFGFLIGIGIFSILGFYLLRIALWNTYGNESILIEKNKITYEANYGWFLDAKKSFQFTNLQCSIESVGYEEDHQGILILSSENSKIDCSVKMPKKEIEEISPTIETAANSA